MGDDGSEPSAGTLFPNPASDFVNIPLDKDGSFFKNSLSDRTQEKQPTMVHLQNTEGKLIRSFNPLATDSFMKIDISDLPAGMYFVVIKQNGETRTEKIVKN